MKVLITKCKVCKCIVSGNVVPDFTELPYDLYYDLKLYGINSKENRQGFKITGCKCRNNETKES